MGSTRQSTHLTPIKIFNDSFGTDQQSHINISSPLDNAPCLQPAANVLAPRTDFNSKFIPAARAGRSPSKPGPHTSSPPLKHVLSTTPGVSFPTPKLNHTTDSLIKKPSPASSYQNIAPQVSSRQNSTAPSMFPSSGGIDKENVFPSYSSDNFAEFPGPEYVSRGLNKRPLVGASPYEDHSSKAPRITSAPVRIPEPHEMPDIIDDGKKPRYTYAQLVAMAILRSPQRKLTLSAIYEWISKTFAFYRQAAAGGWQNSIRHNLSLHKAFTKVERPRNDPGKGHYWIIETDRIPDFLDEKLSRRPASSSNSNRPSSRPSSSHGPPIPGPALAPMQPHQQQQIQQQLQQPSLSSDRPSMQPPPARRMSTSVAPAVHALSNKAQQAVEPSSDATIPLSDPALLEEDGEEAWVDIARPSSRARQSSPQPPMHSSPPVPHVRSRASTSTGNDLLSSTHGTKKPKRVSMNDSGYYSSIESSAMRRPHSRAGLDSLAASRKHGRAELEIARLRSSSQDISPAKTPYLGVPRNSTPGLLSSSPTRPLDQPLTPGLSVKFGPKSAQGRKTRANALALSPDTQLANHRNKVNQLIGTPLKGMTNDLLADFMATPQSPAFNILEDTFDLANLSPNVKFNFFGDDQSPLKRRNLAGRSPEKFGSATRPGLLRSTTTPANALGDITRTASNRPSPAGLRPPVRFMSRLGSPLRFASPEKAGVDGGSDSGSRLAVQDAVTLTSSPFKRLFGDFKSPIRMSSPFNKNMEDLFGEDPVKLFDFNGPGDMFSLDLFADDDNKVESPLENNGQSGRGSSNVGGLDLAGGFEKIGSEAFNDKENALPAAKRQKTVGKSDRPALGGRSNTSFL